MVGPCGSAMSFFSSINVRREEVTLNNIYLLIGIPNHCEPPGQNVSIVSQMCLILVSNCLKRSQFYLKHVSDKMSQFGLNLRPF